MPIDKDELKKLSPENRIKRLKELEVERKGEIEEAEDLIKRTEAEIEHDKNVPDMDVPELEPVDITKMFEAPAGIEGTVVNAPMEEEGAAPKYGGTIEPETAPGYVSDEREFAQGNMEIKVEDKVKYEGVQEADGSASRSVIKSIKKYTRG